MATVLSALLICLLWMRSTTRSQSVGLYVTIGGPPTIMRCDGPRPRLLVIQVLPKTLKLGVEDVDDQALLDRLRDMPKGNVAHAIYIVAQPDIATGRVIYAIDVANGASLNFPIVLVTPTVERGACPIS